ncbi:glycogen-binding subunit 76A [Sitodiplosis mosellana]|uniref:glycogen-binding subunit 76A n=1 Tax=Sitodiplosis mosellana TaxID=263140 RepID=UPI002443AA7E|nr:glycogen-binding subunit 76A [Sitodiplosis mosellana]XP_055323786.1 glycogen-binding subunit 76A [Sitodiplosis mosellana]XP_055323787.1 glycogen-binding subunit 76A [Sitodiplosis mosellana]XP_055323788.1 glycogen-binding subunit 76A [Sitodiplosis mosellana]XP_055323790.1 glycogen-binding subunit 76A [Sitodiplosis mosellana]XP_055323791.1 glycogen-binding subunit 76A [Sitodiplosis mosellana]XP_055323792.1 glycogen-binding subunit 76A [Sitodiplosis mosellana]XP_055323793.1 glycogen-binding 
MSHSSNRSSSTERPCGLTALLPIGMSCRGRAEAFARSLQSRLRTLGTQSNESTPITSGNTGTENSWLNSGSYTQASANVTNHQPVATGNGIHDVADSYFDFDIPGSPVDEGEYARLINTSNTSTATPQENAPESGYVCASPISSVDNNIGTEHSDSSSTDDPFFDPECSDNEQRSTSLSCDYYDCDDSKKDVNAKWSPHQEEEQQQQREPPPSSSPPPTNQHQEHQQQYNGFDGDKSTESLPDTLTHSTVTTSKSLVTVGNDADVTDFCASPQLLNENNRNGGEHHTSNAKDMPDQNHVAIQLERTNSISTNETVQHGVDVREIPKYDPNTPKESLTVDHYVNGHSSEEEDEPVPRSERFRRSSSLKTGKTPPGTPGRKKIVRFADVLGLDLADVRTFLDEIPKVPKSAFDELTIAPEPPISLGQRLDKIIVPLFQQPGASPNFLDIVQIQNVAMENAAVTDPICLTITGLVRVRNLDFHKSVHIRYSLDAWKTYSDLQAEYVPNSCDGFSDKFTFTVFGNSMEIGQRIEIAIRFSCKGEQFWDSNHGVNYCFQCMPATTPQLQTSINNVQTENNPHHHVHLHDSWCGSSFY